MAFKVMVRNAQLIIRPCSSEFDFVTIMRFRLEITRVWRLLGYEDKQHEILFD